MRTILVCTALIGTSVAPSPCIAVQATEVSQSSATYTLLFEWDDDSLTPEIRQHLDRAIAAVRQSERVTLVIAGVPHSNPDYRSSYGVGMSQRRAVRIRDYLLRSGIPASAVMTGLVFLGQPRPDMSGSKLCLGPAAANKDG